MTTHDLKCWPSFFEPIANGVKPFEVRSNDREFKVGDVLLLREFEPCRHCGGCGRVWDNGDRIECDCTVSRNPRGVYTGPAVRREVTFVLEDFVGLRAGYVVLGLKE